MPITGANGGLIGADNTPAAAGDPCATAVTSTGCYSPTSTTATVIYLSFFALSVICALTWAFQFYRPHNLQAASIALALTALLTIPMVVIAFRTSIPMGFALLPYQAWVAIAANLSYTYSKLN